MRSLAASCELDLVAHVYDLRTGRSILALEGHVKPVRDFKLLLLIPCFYNIDAFGLYLV